MSFVRLLPLVMAGLLATTLFAATAQAIFIPNPPPVCQAGFCADVYCYWCDADPGVKVTGSGLLVDVYLDPLGVVLTGSQGNKVVVSGAGNSVNVLLLPAVGPAASACVNGTCVVV